MVDPTVVVTGASGAVGASIAEELRRDHRVLGLVRRAPRDRVDGVEYVVSDYASDALRELSAGLPGLDALVHATGVAPRLTVGRATDADWAEAFAVNVALVASVTRAFLPLLRESRGTVIALNSGAGLTTPAGNAVYSASKHALRSLMDSLRVEERSAGVRVTSIFPGPIESPLLAASLRAHPGIARPRSTLVPVDVARAVRYVLSQRPDAMITELAIRPALE